MRNIGVKISQVVDFMVELSRSYENMDCIRKDVQNRLDAIRHAKLLKLYCNTLLVYLTAKTKVDHSFSSSII